MRRLLLVLLLLGSSPAWAQKSSIDGVAGSTTSAQLKKIITDSTGTGPLVFGPPSLSINSTPVTGGTAGGIMFKTGGGLLSTTDGTSGSANLTNSGTFVLRPVANTWRQAINSYQVGPASGTDVGPLYFNQFSGLVRSGATGAGLPGQTDCACIALLQASLDIGGDDLGSTTQTFGGSFGIHVGASTTSQTDIVGLSAGVTSKYPVAGIIDGLSAGVYLGDGGYTRQLAGIEIDSAMVGTAATPNRLGLVIASQGTGVGSVVDAAIGVSTSGGEGANSGAWKKVIALYTQSGAIPHTPVATDADFFWSDSAVTIANFANLPNVTVTGRVLNFPNVVLTGAGNLRTAGYARLGSTNNPINTTAGDLTVQRMTAGDDSSLAGTTIRAGGSLTGSTLFTNISANGTFAADVTTARNYSSVTSTASGSTMDVSGYFAGQGTFGGTVNNQYGFFASSNLTGGASNFGFYSNIASATAAWNFYAAGTAKSFFNGPVLLGANGLTVSSGSLGFAKITASGTAPGAAGAKLELVCGTNAGTAKLVISAGTSATTVTIADNIGTGVTGC